MSHRNPLTRSLRLLAIAIAISTSATNLWAQEAALQEAPTGPVWNASAASPFEAFLAKLDSPIYAEREQASEQLILLHTAIRFSLQPTWISLFDAFILESSNRADISPEQRARLIHPMRHRFFRKPRGGVGMGWQQLETGLQLTQVVAGFPCRDLGLLETGDVLLAIDGIDVSATALQQHFRNGNSNIVRATILSHEPGDVVKMTVLRKRDRHNDAGQPVQNVKARVVYIPLGRYDDLVNNAPLTQDLLERAWPIYLRRLGITATTAEPSLLIPSNTSKAQWEANRMHPGMMVPPSITIGSPHAGADESFYDDLGFASTLRQGGQSKLLIGPNGMVRPGAQLRANQPRALPTREQIRMQQISQQLAHKRTLQKNLADVNALIAKSNSRLELPELLPQERRSIEINLKKFTAQVETYESLIRQLNISLVRLGVANQAPVKAPK